MPLQSGLVEEPRKKMQLKVERVKGKTKESRIKNQRLIVVRK